MNYFRLEVPIFIFVVTTHREIYCRILLFFDILIFNYHLLLAACNITQVTFYFSYLKEFLETPKWAKYIWKK